ncbi:uncharacterized protein LOC113940374 [Corapipo altera]|uniref:uncharacterized protein LOC113940374 n=1 Tax=Corapipo altera TaxID=415028 RepID=UPI000FD69BDD|nr:uncharacterized protein LOC113940374 [Corapipo altera]
MFVPDHPAWVGGPGAPAGGICCSGTGVCGTGRVGSTAPTRSLGAPLSKSSKTSLAPPLAPFPAPSPAPFPGPLSVQTAELGRFLGEAAELWFLTCCFGTRSRCRSPRGFRGSLVELWVLRGLVLGAAFPLGGAKWVGLSRVGGCRDGGAATTSTLSQGAAGDDSRGRPGPGGGCRKEEGACGEGRRVPTQAVGSVRVRQCRGSRASVRSGMRGDHRGVTSEGREISPQSAGRGEVTAPPKNTAEFSPPDSPELIRIYKSSCSGSGRAPLPNPGQPELTPSCALPGRGHGLNAPASIPKGPKSLPNLPPRCPRSAPGPSGFVWGVVFPGFSDPLVQWHIGNAPYWEH